MTAEELVSLFRTRNCYSSNILMLSAADALDLVAQARAADIPVLGVDSFRLLSSGVQPIDILDNQLERNDRIDSWMEASSFITVRQDSGQVFEVVLRSSK